MGQKGLSFHRKPKEPVKRDLDLTRTSKARSYLTEARKKGTPEQIADAEKKVSELHPDMLLDRRRV